MEEVPFPVYPSDIALTVHYSLLWALLAVGSGGMLYCLPCGRVFKCGVVLPRRNLTSVSQLRCIAYGENEEEFSHPLASKAIQQGRH